MCDPGDGFDQFGLARSEENAARSPTKCATKGKKCKTGSWLSQLLCISRTAEVNEAKDTLVRDFLAEFGGLADQSTGTVSTAAARKQEGPGRGQSQNAKGRTDISRVAALFDRPINEASRILDICPTVLKKICRKHGLKRWPNRRIRSIDKQIALLETVIADGCSNGDDQKRKEIADQIYLLQVERSKICFQEMI